MWKITIVYRDITSDSVCRNTLDGNWFDPASGCSVAIDWLDMNLIEHRQVVRIESVFVPVK